MLTYAHVCSRMLCQQRTVTLEEQREGVRGEWSVTGGGGGGQEEEKSRQGGGQVAGVAVGGSGSARVGGRGGGEAVMRGR